MREVEYHLLEINFLNLLFLFTKENLLFCFKEKKNYFYYGKSKYSVFCINQLEGNW